MSSPARRESADAVDAEAPAPAPAAGGEASSAGAEAADGGGADVAANAEAGSRPRPAKRPLSVAVIEISDTDSDDSSVCAVTSYQASPGEVKRIRGRDDYSSSSSSYSSDSESPCEDDSVVLHRPAPAPPRAPLNLRALRTDDPQLNSSLKAPELMGRVGAHWRERKRFAEGDVTLTGEPFPLCLLHRFLANPEIINNIVDDMNTLDWSRKKMDLYEFHQTADLARLTWQRSIRGIYDLLKTQAMAWVSAVTGAQLTHVSASCSLYGPGDHLLVHDDLLGDRRVAFILYLAPWTPRPPRARRASRCGRDLLNGAGDHGDVAAMAARGGWLPSMGGALELLARDASGRPTRPEHAVTPANNTLALFRVGPDSYHQVAEVTSLELPRLSINGWFHGPASPRASPPRAPSPAASPLAPQRPHGHVVVLGEWLEATYMSARARLQVQAQMERASEVQLRQLLRRERYREVVAALAAPDVPWEAQGPADRRRYERLPLDWAEAQPEAHPVRALLRLVSGTAFFRLLVDCTDLKLTAYRDLELQRWSAGDYTLLPSRERYDRARLEALVYLGVPRRPLCGGASTYVAPEDAADAAGAGAGAEAGAGGALVTLTPESNALNLVYCEAGVARFTKYLSRMTLAPDRRFYVLTATYCE